MKIFRYIFLITFLSIILAVGLLETPLGKRVAQNFLLKNLTQSGLSIDVESISGNLPYQILLKNVQIERFKFDEVELNISLIYLLKRQLHIKSMQAKGFQIVETEKTFASAHEPISELPISIAIQKFHIEGEFNLDGRAKIRRSGSGKMEVTVKKTEIENAYVYANASWNKNRTIEGKVHLSTASLSAFSPWIEIPVDGALELDVTGKGTIDEYQGQLDAIFQAKNVPNDYLDTEWKAHSHFKKTATTPLAFEQLLISSEKHRFQGTANLDSSYRLNQTKGEIRAQIPQGLVFASVRLDQSGDGYLTKIDAKSESIDIEGEVFDRVTATINGILADSTFIGTDKVNATYLNESWEATSAIAFRPGKSLLFEEIDASSILLKAKGNVALRMPEMKFVGKFAIDQADLQILNRLHLTPLIYGSGHGTFSFDASNIYADINANQIRYEAVVAETGHFYHDQNGLKISAGNIQWKTISFDSADIDWTGRDVSLTAKGLLENPVDVQLNGTLENSGSEWKGSLTNVSGSAFNQLISLKNPANFSKSKDLVYCAPISIQFGVGIIDFDYIQTSQKTDATLNLTNFPLDLLSVNPLEVPVGGDLNFKATIQEENGVTTAQIATQIEKGVVHIQGNTEPINLYGDLTADFKQNHLIGKTNLFVSDQPYLALDCDIPMTIETRPFAVHLLKDQKVQGNINLHGKIEEVIDFFNLGTHRIEGDIDCEMKLSGKLNKPRVQGALALTNGHYQNYLTGTELSDLSGTLVGKGDELSLHSLTGHDAKYGQCHATGYMKLNPANDFPFQIDADFTDLTLLQLDLVSADAIGKVTIHGNLKSAEAIGIVEVLDCQIAIPDKIPRSFPELQVVYKNAPYITAVKDTPKQKAYPLHLDLTVNAPKSIMISGRGLNSEWKGSFTVEGTYMNPAVKGKLELVNGEFVFAGKPFKLLDGSVSMFGQSYETPQIDIAANTSEKGVSITARIKGPINAPQITFQSSPPLPLSGIISYLIFGKDLSEVSGLQALQLAGTIATVAGEGPDILEMTRKSLGVDRLQIVMTPSSLDDGAETITLEVGKIIFPGFMLTIRQGAEDSAPNIKIEVDLSRGFTLGLESQQQIEEGKFSLNWNINY